MSITICHNSQLPQYRTPGGAVSPGTEVALSLTACGCAPDVSCRLSLWREGDGQEIPMEASPLADGSIRFSTSLIASAKPCLCWYYFILEQGGDRIYYGNNAQRLGGEGERYADVPPAFQITVYGQESVPEWYRNSIVYQIFPDRFARSADWMQLQQAADKGPDWKGLFRTVQQNWYDTPYYTRNPDGGVTRWPFFGGTLQGIRSKLLYLKSMGAGAIYLNPIFAASSNHKYDTADYMTIDPAFGTLEDFRQLARDARRLGIRLILDGVFNHTGADSLYFNQFGNYPDPGACQGEESPYYKWYRFTRFPDEYECWWGVGALPNVEESCPDYQDFIYGAEDSVIRYWLRQGASGWRLDVADELPDAFIAGIRKAVKETDSEGLLIGEVWEDASNKVSYGVQRRYFLGEELDSVMNYPFRDLLTGFMLGRLPAEAAVKGLSSLAENYPPGSFYGALNLVGSHDRVRILTLLGDAPENFSDTQKECYRLTVDKLRLAKRRLKALSLLQYILPGVPCLYYGDEAGAQGFEDPYNRGTYPWGREDEELMAHFRMLAILRKQYGFLADGDFSLTWQGEHILIASRCGADGNTRDKCRCGESLIAVVNRHLFGSIDVKLELPQGTEYVLELLESREFAPEEGGCLSLSMDPLCAKLFYCTSRRPQPLSLSRSAGVLCHVSSLPSGRLDSAAEKFIDYLAAAGQRLWQILPINPVDEFSFSPYSSSAVFAGEARLLGTASELRQMEVPPAEYEEFCRKEAFWLEDYALYRVLKEHFGGLSWQKWPDAERRRENLDYWREEKKNELDVIKREQFCFWKRWEQVKRYANSKGISIIGDVPIYAAVDSADTWAHPEAFLLGEDGWPLAGSGVPPDYFSEDGQNWGNPVYDWDALKADGYRWWMERISHAMARFDYVRLDHFRSFSAFYAIPAGKTARDGWWLPGPGKEFFDYVSQKLGQLPFLAEDLGFLDAQVYNLIKLTGYPGMLVYQLSADEIEHISDERAAGRVFYPGTHDNQTLAGWCQDTGAGSEEPEAIIRRLYQSKAPWVIVPLQDFLGLGDESRMNTPGQAEGNWTWKVDAGLLTQEVAAHMKELAAQSGR
ncbi:MAG: 4-alpha-glucanotransferase [Firmicutes bacterium]|nr:4-alpha-glucanotransferase [Bacillota bacterium]